jgi:hypothetical protein
MPQSNTLTDADLTAQLTALVHLLRVSMEHDAPTAIEHNLGKIMLLFCSISTEKFLRIRRQLRKDQQFNDDEAFVWDYLGRTDDIDAPNLFGA